MASIYPIIITELTSKEINLLQKELIGTTDLIYPNDGTSSFKVLSYNKSIDIDSLNVLCNNYLNEVTTDLANDNWKEVVNKYKTFKLKLRLNSVIVFEIGVAN